MILTKFYIYFSWCTQTCSWEYVKAVLLHVSYLENRSDVSASFLDRDWSCDCTVWAWPRCRLPWVPVWTWELADWAYGQPFWKQWWQRRRAAASDCVAALSACLGCPVQRLAAMVGGMKLWSARGFGYSGQRGRAGTRGQAWNSKAWRQSVGGVSAGRGRRAPRMAWHDRESLKEGRPGRSWAVGTDGRLEESRKKTSPAWWRSRWRNQDHPCRGTARSWSWRYSWIREGRGCDSLAPMRRLRSPVCLCSDSGLSGEAGDTVLCANRQCRVGTDSCWCCKGNNDHRRKSQPSSHDNAFWIPAAEAWGTYPSQVLPEKRHRKKRGLSTQTVIWQKRSTRQVEFVHSTHQTVKTSCESSDQRFFILADIVELVLKYNLAIIQPICTLKNIQCCIFEPVNSPECMLCSRWRRTPGICLCNTATWVRESFKIDISLQRHQQAGLAIRFKCGWELLDDRTINYASTCWLVVGARLSIKISGYSAHGKRTAHL